jgi:hypothetical protein
VSARLLFLDYFSLITFPAALRLLQGWGRTSDAKRAVPIESFVPDAPALFLKVQGGD